MEEKENLFKKILPTLEVKRNAQKSKHEVKVFQGKKGIKAILENMLKEKIELHQKCINNKPGYVKFGNIGGGGDSTSSLLLPDSKTGWTVEGISFDEFIRENEINDCNFIKMDIEGGEVIVLPSMKIFLEKNGSANFKSAKECLCSKINMVKS